MIFGITPRERRTLAILVAVAAASLIAVLIFA